MTTLALPSGSTLTNLPVYEQVIYGYLARYQCAATKRAYIEDLKNYDAWCRMQGLEPLTARRAHLDLYVRWMQAQNRWAESTISRRIGTVCGMLRYACVEEYIDKDPSVAVVRPTVDHAKQQRTWLSPSDFGLLLRTARKTGPIEHGLVAILGLMALRVGEACSLNVDSIGRDRGYVVLNYIGKGGKAAISPVPVPAMKALDGLVAGREHGPLFRNADGNRMDRACAARMLRRLCQTAGVEQIITPHGLRRTFATSALLAKTPIYEVQLAMRHKSPATTARYDCAQHNPDRNATHPIAAFMASMAD